MAHHGSLAGRSRSKEVELEVLPPMIPPTASCSAPLRPLSPRRDKVWQQGDDRGHQRADQSRLQREAVGEFAGNAGNASYSAPHQQQQLRESSEQRVGGVRVGLLFFRLVRLGLVGLDRFPHWTLPDAVRGNDAKDMDRQQQ